jgi:hypothetical protein
MNTLLLLGMLGTTGVAASGVAQFANQSFNALQFFWNRNASNSVSDHRLAASYFASVTVSVGLAVWLRRRYLRVGAGAGAGVGRKWVGPMLVPLVAAGLAKPLQIGLMRSDELSKGVTLFDARGEGYGSSQVAGALAVGLTVCTRVLYLGPPMLLPPLLMRLVTRRTSWGLLPRSLLNVCIVAFMSAITTPACIALFNQQQTVPTWVLEERFSNVHDKEGRLVRHFCFNRGL